ncbi:MAG: hypothetical protein CSA70_08065 [Rhodobacterales bacterium]|nr:MAG: hypothetical protein CSA70_08065 [Rhodobacterales bacterium]
MIDRKFDDLELDELFNAAKATPVEPGDDLMARVLAQALHAQADQQMIEPATSTCPILRSLFAAIGGWPALGGLIAAGVTGIWIGFSPTLGVGSVMAGVYGTETEQNAYMIDLFPEFDFGLAEGDAG